MGKPCFVNEFTDSMNKMRGSIQNISDLLSSGSMTLGSNATAANPWTLIPVYEDDNCSMGLVKIKSEQSTPCDPHVHPDSNEYLIVTKGKLLLYINGNAVRTVTVGECASIPKGVVHFSQPLEPLTEMVYVCVPKDKKIPEPPETKD